jgi:AmmeMemoRadiSam system protein A
MVTELKHGEREILLQLARQALEAGVAGNPLPEIDLSDLPAPLQEIGASFVTLTIEGNLRGCIGTLSAQQPLAEDVREHAVAAALSDYRFPPVTESELADINIEISRLTSPQPVQYDKQEELLDAIRPHLDGVIIRSGIRRATFLPQVWQKIPEPAEFLGSLCLKMGVDYNYWRVNELEVLVYQVEEFNESGDKSDTH